MICWEKYSAVSVSANNAVRRRGTFGVRRQRRVDLESQLGANHPQTLRAKAALKLLGRKPWRKSPWGSRKSTATMTLPRAAMSLIGDDQNVCSVRSKSFMSTSMDRASLANTTSAANTPNVTIAVMSG
jgi:hypothetical protein